MVIAVCVARAATVYPTDASAATTSEQTFRSDTAGVSVKETALQRLRTNEALNQLTCATESFTIIGKVLYLHAPDGIARSGFVKSVEKVSGTRATAW